MKKWYESLKKAISLVVIAQMLFALLPVLPVYAGDTGKIRICHAKGQSDGYNSQEISANGTDTGHSGHDNDIIPPSQYLVNGLNWTTGKSVWAGNCGDPVATFGVAYDGNGETGGTVPTDTNLYDSGGTVTVLGNTGLLAKTGYTFSGWNTLADGTGTTYLSGSTFQINTNTILYARWITGTYTLDYIAGANGIISGTLHQTVEHGLDGSLVTAVPNEGYKFIGWSDGVLTTSRVETNVQADKSVTANFAIDQYTITFDSNGGSPVSPITQDFGTTVTPPTNPTRPGYTFNGWSPVLPATMPAGSMTVTAQWTVNEYTITFDSNGGSPVSPITQDFGTTVTPPADPTRPGYTFNGWSPVLPATMPGSGISVTANWLLLSPVVDSVTPVIAEAVAQTTAPEINEDSDIELTTTSTTTSTTTTTTRPESEGEVKGLADSSTKDGKACPWWWIIALFLGAVSISYGVYSRRKNKGNYLAWIAGFGVVAWILHYFLHKNYESTVFCDWYWLVVLAVVAVSYAIYRFLLPEKDNK